MPVPTISTYESYEKSQDSNTERLRRQSEECISCPVCSSQWFEEISVNRYQTNHHIIIGQDIPQEPNTVPFKLLKCVNCKELLEPRILHDTRDMIGGRYDDFLDTLEGKGDLRNQKNTQTKEKDVISSEEL